MGMQLPKRAGRKSKGIPKPLEKDIQRDILQYLRLRGIFCWRQNSGAMQGEYKGKKRFVQFTSEPGICDIIGLLPSGRLLAIEVKRPGGKAKEHQQSFIDQINASNGIAVVITSLSEVITLVDSLLAETTGLTHG